jgi:beta-lactamase superfamily II metal-dependent hydrolase
VAHRDHFGGLPELAKQIPIKEYIDHGPNAQSGQVADDRVMSRSSEPDASPYLGGANHEGSSI